MTSASHYSPAGYAYRDFLYANPGVARAFSAIGAGGEGVEAEWTSWTSCDGPCSVRQLHR